jgi:antitoxin component YwqK of YwqJK toxin-antitoxin module
MKLLFIILAFLLSAQAWPQRPDNYVKTIEKLKGKGKLTTMTYPCKTFVGSLTGYRNNGSLVLINSLTDAEAAGTETLYYLKNGILRKVFIMNVTFDSNDEWQEYYLKHKSADRCQSCHGKPNCIVTEITLGDTVTIVVIDGKEKTQLTPHEKKKMLMNIQTTSEELKALLKELE